VFDRFTDRARKALGYSRQESQRCNHDYIGPEHILLGIILEGTGVAADVLKNLDVDANRLRQETERRMAYGTTMVTMGQLPFTPRGKKVLELALDEASGLGHNYIGTEHLLLGLIREETGIAAHALQAVHVRLDDVREEVLEVLGDQTVAEPVRGQVQPGPLTQGVRDAMDHASVLARHSAHEEIGTEHILLGILDQEERGGELTRLLRDHLRAEIENLMTPGTAKVAKAPVSLAPGAKRVLDLALEAARDCGADRVAIRHLIAGLLREGQGIAARVLGAAGIRVEDVLRKARKGAEPAPDLVQGALRIPQPSLFDRFISRKAMGYARQEAMRLGHHTIGTEHALLGLLLAGGGAMDALLRLDADPHRVRAEVERLVIAGDARVSEGQQLPFTPGMRKALEFSLEEALLLGRAWINDEHVLLGLLREGGSAAQALAACGVTLDAVRKSLGPPAPPE
jgi:ATP-dependent Clp protease ATP-binding subunit ClpA